MGSQNHGASAIRDAIVGVCGDVIQELVYGFSGIFCGFGLLRADGAEGGEELVIYGPGVVEQGADDALYAFDARRVQWR